MTETALFIGVILLALGVVAATLPRCLRIGLWGQAAGVLLCGVAAVSLFVHRGFLGASFVSGLHPSLGIDSLTAFFIIVIAATATPVLIFATRSVAHNRHPHAIGALTGAFVGSLLLVVCARDLSTFLAGWELMTLIPALTILVNQSGRPVRRAVFVYLAMTHLGGAFVWLALILLSHAGILGNPELFSHQSQLFQTFVWLAAVIGFGTKAGLMPMHTWLPRAHPVAPAHISALMSGVMIKVALYGLIRVLFDWTTGAPPWVAVLVIGVGALSSLGGIFYAVFERDLKRLLAFSSVENAGIITLGIGASLLFANTGQPLWSSLAFAAALLHTLNHAVFKGALFLGAGAIDHAVHTHDLDHLGGLIKRMPWTGVFFIIAALAIAGVPPLNGFVSEWLTLQAFIHLALSHGTISWIGPLGVLALAGTAAMAALCFVKVIGLALLGPPRSVKVAEATEVPWEMRAAPGLLALMCVGLGAAPGILLPRMTALRGGVETVATNWEANLPHTGGLPVITIIVALIFFAILLTWMRRSRVAAPAPTWACGQDVIPALNWTSDAFTKPLQLVFRRVLRPSHNIKVHRVHGVIQTASYRTATPHLFDTLLYTPTVALAMRLAEWMRHLQSGSLRTYTLHLAGLVGLLLLLARIGVVQ